MLIRAVPVHDFAFLCFCITQLGPCVVSSRLTLPVLCEALRFFSVAVPCHSLPFLGSALLIDSRAMLRLAVSFPIEANPPLLSSLPTLHQAIPGPRFSFLFHCQSGPSNSNAMPSYSNAKLVNSLALLFIALTVRNSADLCHRRAAPHLSAALLLPASLCHFIAWPIIAAASHVRVVHFQCLASPSVSRAKPSPTDLLSAAAFHYKTNLCLNYAIDCFSRAVRCFSFPLLGYAEPLPCHSSLGHCITIQCRFFAPLRFSNAIHSIAAATRRQAAAVPLLRPRVRRPGSRWDWPRLPHGGKRCPGGCRFGWC